MRATLRAAGLAIVLPVGVGFLAGWALLHPPEEHGFARAFDRRMDEHSPEVLVLGSSLAHRGVDLGVLARELGVPRDRVEMLQLPHASAAHWYAILKNRVYERGHRPRLVIVAGALTTMLNHDLLQTGGNLDRLVEQLGPSEPVLSDRVLGLTSPADFFGLYARTAASRWRDHLLTEARDRVLLAFTTRPRLDEATRLAERVNEAVFSNARMDYELHREAGVGASGGLAAHAPDTFVLREQGLLDAMDALADAHGSQLVWVRMPFPPSNRDVDSVPPEIESDALAWWNELGSGYLDLRSLDLSDADFEDMRHLSRRGAVTFTVGLARALQALRAGGGMTVVQGVKADGAPTRHGDAPALSATRVAACSWIVHAPVLVGFTPAVVRSLPEGVGLPFQVLSDGVSLPMGSGEGCDGSWVATPKGLQVAAPHEGAAIEVLWADAHATPLPGGPAAWVVPGTSLRFAVSTPWTLPAPAFAMLARGLAVGSPAVASVGVDGLAEPLRGEHGRLSAILRPRVPTGPWWVEVSVPSDAAPFLLHHLAVGAPPTTSAFLGQAETLFGASVRIVGGRLDDTRGRVTYAAPPRFDPIPLTPRMATREMAAVPVPKLADLADADEKDAARPSACSPARVLEDGTPLPLPHELCYDVLTKGGGRACHAAGSIYFASLAGGAPWKNGAAYTLALDPSRACPTLVQPGATTLRGSWWLYPGDEATFAAGKKGLDVFRDGASRLVLGVLVRGEGDSPLLDVEVLVDGEVVSQTTWVPPAGPRESTLTWPIDPPLPASASALAVRVRNPDARSFVLVTLLALEEGAAATVERAPAPGARTAEVRVVDPVSVARVPADGVTVPTARVVPQGPGVWEVSVPSVAAVHPLALERAGLGPWSPVRLAVDGVPMLTVASRKTFRVGCEACFVHVGDTLLVRPGAATLGRVEATLDPAAPMLLAGGEPVWWVYAGQDLVVTPPASLGAVAGTVRAEVMGFQLGATAADSGARLQVGEAASAFVASGQPGVGVAELPWPGGDVTIAIQNGSRTGFLLVGSVEIDTGVERLRLLRSGKVPPPAEP